MRLRLREQVLLTFLTLVITCPLSGQSWDSIPAATSKENAPLSRREADLPKGPAPHTEQGHPDLSGYWIPSGAPKDKPVGNLGKDLPGFAL